MELHTVKELFSKFEPYKTCNRLKMLDTLLQNKNHFGTRTSNQITKDFRLSIVCSLNSLVEQMSLGFLLGKETKWLIRYLVFLETNYQPSLALTNIRNKYKVVKYTSHVLSMARHVFGYNGFKSCEKFVTHLYQIVTKQHLFFLSHTRLTELKGTCCICLESDIPLVEITYCNHADFCENCIFMLHQKQHTSCPLCRTPFTSLI